MDDIVLRAGALSLTIRPAWGGRIIALHHARHGDLLVPITASHFEPDAWPKGGGYPLVPFHNRIRNGRFSFGGRTAALPIHPDAAPNALHGMGSRVIWKTVACNEQEARLRWRHTASSVWPWSFLAEQTCALATDGLELTLAIWNEDDATMPAGLGWHPYFPSRFALRHDAKIAWPNDDGYLPLGHQAPVQPFKPPASAYLSDWTNIELASANVHMRMRATNLQHLVLHAPDAPYLCVEPVSHLAAAANDPERRPGAEEGGMHHVAPGQSLSATVHLHVD